MINKTNGYYYLSEEALNKVKLLGFNIEFTFNISVKNKTKQVLNYGKVNKKFL